MSGDTILTDRERLIHYGGSIPARVKKARKEAKRTKDEVLDPETLDWSDEESDWLPKSPPKPEFKAHDRHLTDQPSITQPDFKKDDHKRSSAFRGDVVVPTRKIRGLLKREERVPKYASFRLPIPYLPSHMKESLGEDIVEHLWYEFLEYGADESELVKVSVLKKINLKMEKHLGYSLSIDKLKFKGLERNDFVDFHEVCAQLVLIAERANTTVKRPKLAEPKIALPACGIEYCQPGDEGLHPVGAHLPHVQAILEENQSKDAAADAKGGYEDRARTPVHKGEQRFDGKSERGEKSETEGSGGEEEEEKEDLEMKYYGLNVAYQNYKIDNKGVVRLKHVPMLMEKVGIPYDKSRYDSKQWDLRGEFMLRTTRELDEIAEKIRTDHDDDIGREEDPLYALPKWMETEFKPSEIMLFKHHFKSIDVDGGGDIDEHELQLLTESLGARISLQESIALIEVMDLDGGGTVSFDEFMMLMYKIQNNVIDLEGNLLAKSMIAAKAQLFIFEEIEENMVNPVPGSKVLNYGGEPVTCQILIEGPAGSLYEGSNMKLVVRFLDGYPYRLPEVYFETRLYHLNCLIQYDGQCSLPHIKYLWDSSWNIRKIIEHVIQLLIEPDINMVPVEYIRIVNLFLRERLEAAQTADNERRAEILLAKEEERAAEAERLALLAAQEEEDRLEEERRQQEVRIMSGEDDWEWADNLVEIEDMEKHDLNTIEDDEKRSYRLKAYKAEYESRLDTMTEDERQELAEKIDANEDPDWEEQERMRLEKEEKKRKWDEALALIFWEKENAEYESKFMAWEDRLAEDIRDEMHTMAGTDPLLLLLRELIGDKMDPADEGVTSDELMEKIGRVEQMHLTTIQMFIFEKARYASTVDMYKERFGKVFDPHAHEEEEEESKAGLESKAESKQSGVDGSSAADSKEYAAYLDERAQMKDDAILQAGNDDESESEDSREVEFD